MLIYIEETNVSQVKNNLKYGNQDQKVQDPKNIISPRDYIFRNVISHNWTLLFKFQDLRNICLFEPYPIFDLWLALKFVHFNTGNSS
jgi:hypothetical protein